MKVLYFILSIVIEFMRSRVLDIDKVQMGSIASRRDHQDFFSL